MPNRSEPVRNAITPLQIVRIRDHSKRNDVNHPISLAQRGRMGERERRFQISNATRQCVSLCECRRGIN